MTLQTLARKMTIAVNVGLPIWVAYYLPNRLSVGGRNLVPNLFRWVELDEPQTLDEVVLID